VRLDDFLPVSRDVILERRDDFISDVYRDECEAFCTLTNGTLSTPLTVSFDLAAFYDFNYFSFSRIFETQPQIRDRLETGTPSIYLVTDVPVQQRITVCIPPLQETLLRRLPMRRSRRKDLGIVQYLRKRNLPVLYGKPHVLLHLAELDAQQSRAAERIRPVILLTAGENLYESDRRRLCAWFRSEIINAYTASEAGLIAVDCPYGTGLHVQADRVMVEVLASDGAIAPQGTGEVVITNLMNWGQAFVRYRLGDRATVRHGRCRCGHNGPTIMRLSGHDEEFLDVHGRGTVATADLDAELDRPDVKQYEVEQDESEFLTVRWISFPDTDKEATTAELAAALTRLVGRSYRLVHTEEITVLGGKLRRFVRAGNASQ
jgi:hypothetical protein